MTAETEADQTDRARRRAWCSSPDRPAPAAPPRSTRWRIWGSRPSTTFPSACCPVFWRGRRRNGPWLWAPMRGTGISPPRGWSRSTSVLPRPGIEADLLYLDCEAVTLQRRYSETRRRHPLAPDDDPANGIARELDLLGPLRRRASVLIDTTNMSPHDLRKEMAPFRAPRRCEAVGHGHVLFLPSRAADRGRPGLRLPVSQEPALGPRP
jgi:UPF0042 nucleotide-binding protein